MIEQPTTTPRFAPIMHSDADGKLRFFVVDLNCLDTICECRGEPDANLIASALNEVKVPSRFKVEFSKPDGWKATSPESIFNKNELL